MKLYISDEQSVLRALCASSPVSARRVPPLSVSVLWQGSVVRGAFAGVAAAPAQVCRLSVAQASAVALIPTVASAAAVAPIASVAVTGGVAALGGVKVPGGVEVQGGSATGGSARGASPIDLRVEGDAEHVGTVQHFSTTVRFRTVEQMPAVGVALLSRREVQVQGTSGLTANDQHDLTAPKPNGGVRGIPPRGRPV